MNTKPIAGYESIYEISDCGRVFRISAGQGCTVGKEIIAAKNSEGYMVCSLCKNGKPKSYKIHRLVALAFLDNPQDYTEINHIDGNKKNNNISNLEWASSSMNNAHAHRIGLNGGSSAFPKRAIVGIDIITGHTIQFLSIGEARRHGFHDSTISACCKGKRKQHAGYRWKYA